MELVKPQVTKGGITQQVWFQHAGVPVDFRLSVTS